MKVKPQTFTIHATLTQNVTVIVEANNFVEAWEKAQVISVQEALDAPGDLIDDCIEITALVKD